MTPTIFTLFRWSGTESAISPRSAGIMLLMIECKPRRNAQMAQSQGELEPSGVFVSAIQGGSFLCPCRYGKSQLEEKVLSDLLFPLPQACRSMCSSVLSDCTDSVVKTDPLLVV